MKKQTEKENYNIGYIISDTLKCPDTIWKALKLENC